MTETASDQTTDTAIVWVRRDLRIHDNPVLVAGAEADRLLPVYCFDPREFGIHPYGGPDSFTYQKTGRHRARFLRESVADLRATLRERDAELVVRHDRPETVLPALADRFDADAVYYQTLPAPEERAVEQAVESALADSDCRVESFWTHTLHHRDDLPISVADVPDTFTPFKERVESDSRVRETVETPDLPPTPTDGIEIGSIPDIDALGVESAWGDPGTESSGGDPRTEPQSNDSSTLDFSGGESAGLGRLHEYVWERDCLREYRETRNGLLGPDYSSKLSAWLNQGCLSPRRVYETVREYEAERVANDSTYWLLFELRWRDFFQFQVAKHGGQYFRRAGIRERDIDWSDDDTAFQRWADGETGVPFVDAAMRELAATGYQSNRARQNAASFLANDLRIDWRRGAAYFETQLVDYDPASNYGNWAYVAGVGNDSRNQSFDILWQAHRYDADAEYVRTWCPELADLPPESAHEPWTLTDDEQARYGVELGVDYPEPIIDPEATYDGP